MLARIVSRTHTVNPFLRKPFDVSVVFGRLPDHAERSSFLSDGAFADLFTSLVGFFRTLGDMLLQFLDAKLFDLARFANPLEVAAMHFDATERCWRQCPLRA